MNQINNINENDVYEIMIETAMQIILHSGDAKNIAEEALENAKCRDFINAKDKLKKAKETLVKAHRSQTELVQNEAQGNRHPNSLLFNHAQDTLMTTMTEIKLISELIELYNFIFESVIK